MGGGNMGGDQRPRSSCRPPAMDADLQDCYDTPGWTDGIGNSCSDYEAAPALCASSDLDTDPATKNCCACDGGISLNIPAPRCPIGELARDLDAYVFNSNPAGWLSCAPLVNPRSASEFDESTICDCVKVIPETFLEEHGECSLTHPNTRQPISLPGSEEGSAPSLGDLFLTCLSDASETTALFTQAEYEADCSATTDEQHCENECGGEMVNAECTLDKPRCRHLGQIYCPSTQCNWDEEKSRCTGGRVTWP